MQEWINQALSSGNAPLLIFSAAFLLGLMTSVTSGCNYGILGAIAGYSSTLSAMNRSKNIYYSAIFFLLGSVLTMAFIGGLSGFLSDYISDSFGIWWKIAMGLFAIFFGLYILGMIPFKLFQPSFKTAGLNGNILSSVIFGLTVGGVTSACSACCNPVFPIILATSFLKGSFVFGILLLTFFALGYNIPLAAAMVGIGLGAGKLSKKVNRLGFVLKYVGGVLLIVSGFYFLIA